jgi:uncharacterized protein (DUF2236 family)
MQLPKTYLGWKADFTVPAGEPAYAGPDAVSWQVFKNPVTLAVGGVCAVLLEFADARIRSGVWDHSTFSSDPAGRARRTGLAAMIGVYGPQSAAQQVIRGITRMHARVAGETPSGEAYRALDPELMDWVSATASYSFLMAYHRYARPLSDEEQHRFFAEGEPVARLYGVREPCESAEHFDMMLAARVARFEPHPIIGEFLTIMASGRAAPGVPRTPQRALVHAAIDLLPGAVRARLGLETGWRLTPLQRRMVKIMAGLAERVPEPSGPAAQACQRLGLPRTFLWKAESARRRLLARQAQHASNDVKKPADLMRE